MQCGGGGEGKEWGGREGCSVEKEGREGSGEGRGGVTSLVYVSFSVAALHVVVSSGVSVCT